MHTIHVRNFACHMSPILKCMRTRGSCAVDSEDEVEARGRDVGASRRSWKDAHTKDGASEPVESSEEGRNKRSTASERGQPKMACRNK